MRETCYNDLNSDPLFVHNFREAPLLRMLEHLQVHLPKDEQLSWAVQSTKYFVAFDVVWASNAAGLG